jgi:protein-disulfide isomerase
MVEPASADAARDRARRTARKRQSLHENVGSSAASGVHLALMELVTGWKLDRLPGSRDHALGPPDAPLVLVEYGDYACPDTARAKSVVDAALDELEDRVRFVFRHFPHTDTHAHAGAAAEAAESVAAHGGEEAFWDMHAMLLANQDALEPDDLLGYAEACGVDLVAVADDLSSRAQWPRVHADFESGLRSGVNDTPAFYVNGVCYEDDWSDARAFLAALREAASAVH